MHPKYFILVLFLLVFLACSKIEKTMGFSTDSDTELAVFELSFDNVFLSNFSVKFTPSDTAFIEYNSVEEKLKDSIQPQTIYYSLVPKKKKNDLYDFISSVEFSQPKQDFEEEKLPRGIEYRLYFKKDGEEYFYVLNELDKAPKNLDSLVHKTLRIIPKTKDLKIYPKPVSFKSKITTPPTAPEFEVDSANFD